MTNLSQNDPRWKSQQLGTCTDTIGQSGCVITSIAMLAGVTPDIVNVALRAGNGYQDGCIVKWDVAARLLGLPYDTKRTSPVMSPCIAETNYYAPKVPQHFFIWLGNGKIIDPLDGKEKDATKYPVVSYRNIGSKGDQNMDAIKNALGTFMRRTWFWLNDQQEPDMTSINHERDQIIDGSLDPYDLLGRWISNSQIMKHYAEKQSALDAQIDENARLEALLNKATADDQEAQAAVQKVQNELDSTKLDLLKCRSDLKEAQEGQNTMTPLQMIAEGVRALLKSFLGIK